MRTLRVLAQRLGGSVACRWILPAVIVLTSATNVLAAGADDGGNWLKQMSALDAEGLPPVVRLVVFVTVFSIVPSIVLLTTCFPRILIVLSFLRRALGTQDLPPNMVITGLAFVLTAAVMMPVWREVHATAYQPYVQGDVQQLDEALRLAEAPIKDFMRRHTPERDIIFMLELLEHPAAAKLDESSESALSQLSPSDITLDVMLPAFVLSELRTAFQMGFLLYLPFLMIDLVVAAVLLSMGMFMLPPVLVSLPIKVLVFVLVDGWNLVVGQLFQSLQ